MRIPSSPQKVRTSELRPIDVRFTAVQREHLSQKKEFFGKSPNIFVGRHGYPFLNVGMLGVEEYHYHDDPLTWKQEQYGISSIIDLRSTLVNSSFKAPVKGSMPGSPLFSKFLGMAQEISLSNKPVDVEVQLEREPVFSPMPTTSPHHLPHGPRVRLRKAMLAENPHVPIIVEKAVSDTDLKAAEAVAALYQKNTDTHYLTKLFSVGNLGVAPERKLVPTRWSITAVDDTIGKQLIEEVKQFPDAGYLSFFGSYLGNYYLVLFFPGIWSYELFETLASDEGKYSTDHEFYDGRKVYASNTVGGYYAARLSILEKMKEMKRQASCLCLRFITNEYWAPLGVWVVREAARNAMQSIPIEFGSRELMLEYARHLVRKKFGYPADVLLRESKLLHLMQTQKRLLEWV
ncbi:hypothetical protein HYS47_02915 [Candidatus Woesearchaeota archaeon]|nr:hypothetical protein [Candidatus Woesearchaeota archaeon]